MMILGAAACAKDGAAEMREIKESACGCKSKECAADVGARLAKAAVESELDESKAKLAIEASTCLATFGE